MSSTHAPGSVRISRRTLLKATTATAGALATAAALAELDPPAHAAAGFVNGPRWSPTSGH